MPCSVEHLNEHRQLTLEFANSTRLKNIEETERAKRALYEKRKAEAGGGSLADEDYAATRCEFYNTVDVVVRQSWD